MATKSIEKNIVITEPAKIKALVKALEKSGKKRFVFELLRYEPEWGWTFIDFRLFGFRLSWFTDCGDWFVYVGRKHQLRFSSAGFLYL